MSIISKIPDLCCDVCHKNKATRWFGSTSTLLCNDSECYEIMSDKYYESIKEYEIEDDCY